MSTFATGAILCMKQPDTIIILHYTPYSERAVVLHTVSRLYGRRSFIVRNASRSISFFQPLSILDCEITESPKTQLFSASLFTSAHPLAGIRGSYSKNAISMFMAEVLLRAIREGSQEEGLFEWCRSEILLLDAMEDGFANFHVRFLLDFAAAAGFSPGMADLLPFAEDSAGVLQRLVEAGPAGAMLVPLSGTQRSEACARLLKYLEFHLETPLHIRSLAVLGELF